VLLLCFFWTASTQRLGYDILRADCKNGDLTNDARTIQTDRRCWRHGVARDWRKNKWPGRFLRVSLPLAQGHKVLHIMRRCRFCSEHFPECRLGGADAGSTAANVNLIQPCEKRKAFNTMKHALARTYPYCHTRLGPALDPTARPIMYHRRKLQQNVNSECEGRRFNVLAQACFITATE